jgi:hypothetical protein
MTTVSGTRIRGAWLPAMLCGALLFCGARLLAEDDEPPQRAPPSAPPKTSPATTAPAAPAPACAQCCDTGFVPLRLDPLRPYVANNLAAAKPQPAVPWAFCPACKKGADPKELLQAETARLAAAGEAHKEWEQKSGLTLQYLETHHAAVRSNLPPGTNQALAEMIEKTTIHIQNTFQTVLLTPLRPDNLEIIIGKDDDSFKKIVKVIQARSEDTDANRQHFEMVARCPGGTHYMNDKYVIYANNKFPNVQNTVLHQVARIMLRHATKEKAPPWLPEGFGAYTENALTRRVLCVTFTYEQGQTKFGEFWDLEIAKLASLKKLRTWEDVFQMELVGLKANDYMSMYAVVSYLIRGEPRFPTQFVRLAYLMREGRPFQEALETAYGKKAKELEAAGMRWAFNPR